MEEPFRDVELRDLQNPPRRDAALEADLNRRLKAGHNVWVVGDVHGHLHVLRRLMEHLQPGPEDRWVLLGDLLDRGPDPRPLVEFVRGNPAISTLEGNHEQLLLRCLDPTGRTLTPSAKWMRVGGPDTLRSYELKEADAIALGVDHALHRDARWFLSLPQEMVLDDWRLVHAGYHPERPLDDQRANDLLWIRDTFFDHPEVLDPVRAILVGHTITHTLGAERGQPQRSRLRLADGRPAWVNLDSSLYDWKPGRLTCLNLATRQLTQCPGDDGPITEAPL